MGWLWHTLAGAALGAGASLIAPFWLGVVVVGGFGIAREMIQHQTVFLTPHQALEGGAWVAGSVLGAVAVGLIR